jgi:hypothetical protein
MTPHRASRNVANTLVMSEKMKSFHLAHGSTSVNFRLVSVPIRPPYTPMKIITTSLLASGALLFSATIMQGQIFTENFQTGYSTGNLSGQNGWTNGFGATPTPSATVTNASGNFFVTSTSTSYSILDAGNFGLTASNTITLTFDLRATETSSHAMFGIGNYSQTSSGAGTPATFGLSSGIWAVRGWGFGTTVNARDSNNSSLAAPLNEWFRVQSTWDLSGTGTGTLSIMNLTLGETNFTPLFFNAAQTSSFASLQLTNANNPGVANWEGVFVRTGNSEIDNLSVVPEPNTFALLIGALGLAALIRRSRFARKA